MSCFTPVLNFWHSQGQLQKNFFTLASGTIAAQLIGLVTFPLLTRIYTPEQFGAMGIFAAVFGTLAPMITLKYEHAVPVAADDEQAICLMALALGIAAIISSASAAMSIYVIPTLFSGPIPTILGKYGWLLGPGLFFYAILTSATYWMIRKNNFQSVARARVKQSLSKVFLELGLGVVNASPFGLICGYLAGQVGGAHALLRNFWASNRTALSQVTAGGIVSAAKQYKNFPFYSMPATGLNALGSNAPLILLPIVYDEMHVGLFWVAQRLAAWPISLIGTSIGQVFYGAITNGSTTATRNLRLFHKLSIRLILIGVSMAVFLASAPLWARHIFGDKWSEAGTVIAILGPMIALRLLTTPVSQAYNVHGKQRLFLIIEGARLILTTGAFIIAILLRYDFLTTITLYSLLSCVSYATHWACIHKSLRNATAT